MSASNISVCGLPTGCTVGNISIHLYSDNVGTVRKRITNAATIISTLIRRSKFSVTHFGFDQDDRSTVATWCDEALSQILPLLDGVVSLTMANLHLSQLPTFDYPALAGLTVLNVERNKFTKIGVNAIQGLPLLKSLFMNNNKIGNIARFLDDARHLKGLDLGYNDISALPADMFGTTTRLSYLFLDNNKIKSLPDGIFRPLSVLQALYMARNRLGNSGSMLHLVFATQTNLRSLDLSENSLTKLPSKLFINCNQLRYLSLASNELSNLTSMNLSSQAQLTDLYLNNNSISTLGDILKPLGSLTALSLSKNILTVIPSGPHQKLKLLGISYNQIAKLQPLKHTDFPKLTGADFSGLAISSFDCSALRQLQALNISHNQKLKSATFNSGIEQLDVGYTSIPRDNVNCNLHGTRTLSAGGMTSEWNAADVIKDCLGTEFRALLDVSEMAGLNNSRQINGFTLQHYFQIAASHTSACHPQNETLYFLDANGTATPARLLPNLVIGTISGLGCRLLIESQHAFSKDQNHFYLQKTAVIAAKYNCICVTGFSENKRGICAVEKPKPTFFDHPGNTAAVIILTLLAGMGLVYLAVFLRRRSRAVKHDLQLHRRLLENAEFEVLELKEAWKIDAAHVRLVKRIDGDSPGAFGAVWKGAWDDVPVAVKVLHEGLLDLDETMSTEFEKEADFMMRARHVNVVRFFGLGQMADGQPFLVMELVTRGSLSSLLRGSSSGETGQRQRAALPDARKRQLAEDIACGMCYIHGLGRMHRDLKCGNVLVTTGWRAKVADLGSMRSLLTVGDKRSQVGSMADARSAAPSVSASMLMTRGVGTLLYMAPEMLSGELYWQAADVWSFGVVLWELWTAQLPDLLEQEGDEGRGPVAHRLFKLLEKGARLRLDDDVPRWLRNCIEPCFQHLPSDRPNFPTLCTWLEGRSPPEGYQTTPDTHTYSSDKDQLLERLL